LALLLSRFPGIQLIYVAPEGLEMPSEITQQIAESGTVDQVSYISTDDSFFIGIEYCFIDRKQDS